MTKWFALRVAYGREQRIKEELDDLSVRNYLPMEERFVNTPRGKVLRNLPLIPHTIFVYSTHSHIYELKHSTETLESLRFMLHRDGTPLIVPDKQMEDYMRVVESGAANRMILDTKPANIALGKRVIITQGQFAGVEGTIKRIDGNKRIVVSIADLSYAAITFVPKAFQMPIE